MSAFLDSNILVYVADQRESEKRTTAVELIDAVLDETMDGWISTQTLSEFSNVALKKLHLEIDLVEGYVDVFKSIKTVLPDADVVKRALQVKRRYGIQFYDSMMVAAAERAGCTELLSEDLADGQSYFGVVARNPFNGHSAS